MSMQGNIAIEGYIEELIKFLDGPVSHLREHEILAALRKKLESDKKSAQGGWL